MLSSSSSSRRNSINTIGSGNSNGSSTADILARKAWRDKQHKEIQLEEKERLRLWKANRDNAARRCLLYSTFIRSLLSLSLSLSLSSLILMMLTGHQQKLEKKRHTKVMSWLMYQP
jgi:hypothetical protein